MMPILGFRLMLWGKQSMNQGSSCASVCTRIPQANGLFICSGGTGEQWWRGPHNSFSLSSPQRARRAVLAREEEGSGTGQPVTDYNKKEGNGHSPFHPLLAYSREEGLPSPPQSLFLICLLGKDWELEKTNQGLCVVLEVVRVAPGLRNPSLQEKRVLARSVPLCGLPALVSPSVVGTAACRAHRQGFCGSRLEDVRMLCVVDCVHD